MYEERSTCTHGNGREIQSNIVQFLLIDRIKKVSFGKEKKFI
jgi:hypothetical protein